MPLRITNEIVDIPLNGGMVKGILSGDETAWSFQSLNMDFLSMFGNGIVSSHTYLGVDTRHYEHHRFQLAIAARMNELIDERRPVVRTEPGRQGPMNTVRRFVAP